MKVEAEVTRIVTFRVGHDLFAAPIDRVERVLRYETPRRVPGTASWVEGVIDYGGRVVPVVDLRRRFGMPAADQSSPTRVIVLSAPAEWMAIVVDAVLDVRALEASELETPPSVLRGAALDAMSGMARRGGELVIVLDIDRLVASSGEREQPAAGDELTTAR
ncbi:MAG: chemotaxis protein CheW [Gemmatimonadaceae bacterium]